MIKIQNTLRHRHLAVLFTFTLLILSSYSLISQNSKTFEYSDAIAIAGGIEEWEVPSCVTSITMTVTGADGGNGSTGIGGAGATAVATFAVTPGETLLIAVGGKGLNGGSPNGGGGGAGSGVRRTGTSPISTYLIIAGGGGGGDFLAGGGGNSSGVLGGGTAIALGGGGGGSLGFSNNGMAAFNGGAGGGFGFGTGGGIGSTSGGGNGGFGAGGGGGGGSAGGGGGGGFGGGNGGSNGNGGSGGGSSINGGTAVGITAGGEGMEMHGSVVFEWTENPTLTITPTFTDIDPLCIGEMAPTFPAMSIGGSPINGTWSPATIETSIIGTSDYTFTPDMGQCASEVTIQVEVIDCLDMMSFSLNDPCNCSNPSNTTSSDGTVLFEDKLIIDASMYPAGTIPSVTAVDLNLLDAGGTAVTAAMATSNIVPLGGGMFSLQFYTLPNNPSTLTVKVGGDSETVTTESCSPCVVVPTMGQWGLICLSLLLMIFGLVAIKEKELVIG